MKRYTARRLAKKRPLYGQYQQETSERGSQGGKGEMKAKESTASIQRSGPEELKAALREKIKESTN